MTSAPGGFKIARDPADSWVGGTPDLAATPDARRPQMTVRQLLAAIDELYARDDERAARFTSEHTTALKTAQRGDRNADAPVELVLAIAAVTA